MYKDRVNLYCAIALAGWKAILEAKRYAANKKLRKKVEKIIEDNTQEIIDIDDYVVYSA